MKSRCVLKTRGGVGGGQLESENGLGFHGSGQGMFFFTVSTAGFLPVADSAIYFACSVINTTLKF